MYLWYYIPFKCGICITFYHTSCIPRLHAYLLTTNFNGSPIAGHCLHVPDIIISWVSFTPVDPSWDDGRSRREAGWTLHEQPPNAVTGESGFIASYSRGNPLAHITLEFGLPTKMQNHTSTILSILLLSILFLKLSGILHTRYLRCLMFICTKCIGEPFGDDIGVHSS